LVDFVLEVTVTFTIQVFSDGVPVMVKSFAIVVVLRVAVKNAEFAVPSTEAVINIVTPLGGITEVMSTTRGKGPGDAACSEPLAGGVVDTTNAASGAPPPLLPQETNAALASTADNKPKMIHLIDK
jgi:hypothetical protein